MIFLSKRKFLIPYPTARENFWYHIIPHQEETFGTIPRLDLDLDMVPKVSSCGKIMKILPKIDSFVAADRGSWVIFGI